tara:strand:- start:463 stop:1350 length:888 start_codon:yes stop_codon:yes gene_type:complete
MNKWKNITIELPGINLKPVIEYFSAIDNIYSVSIKDKLSVQKSNWFDIPNKEISLEGDTHKIVFLVKDDYKTNKLINLITAFLKLDSLPFFHEELVDDVDWVKYSQSQFKEILISNKFRIVPPWYNQNTFIGKTIIINPGSGFGTGTHPTTILCLRWIEKNIDHFDDVLDYGSGSGILSIASKLYGAGSVEGVEIDKQAIKNSKNNNQLNHVSIPYYQEEIFKPNKKYNLIISNILQPTLIKLSKRFKILASKKILLSGVLEHQTDTLINSYDWIDLKIIDKLSDWTLLLGKLKS